MKIQEAEKTPNRINLKKLMPWNTKIEFQKTQRQRKNPESNQREMTLYSLGKNNLNNCLVSHQKPWQPEESGTTFFSNTVMNPLTLEL